VSPGLESSVTAETAARGWIGRALPRHEDVRFTTGRARYLDDLRFDDLLFAAFVRSPYAHARIVGLNIEAALARSDVRGVLTGRDLIGRVGEFPINPAEGAEIVRVPHPVLAVERARYVGEPIAVVVGDSPDAAVDAAESVVADLEELPAVVDPEEALEGRPTTLHESAPDNVVLRWSRSAGDVEGAFARAERVVRGRFRMPRLIATPLEPRGAVAAYDDADDLLTIWVSAQDQHRHLANLSAVLRRTPEQLRVVVPEVGGAFGSKGVPAAETAAIALCALDLGRAVKWVETRTENALASYQGRGADVEAELALAADGEMLALRARYIGDVGAYLFPTTPVPAVTAAKLLTGCYAVPAAQVEVLGVATNKVPTGPYRGAGRPEAAFVIERLVDLAAREQGLDRIELRRRNIVAPDRFPYVTPLGFTYDSGDYAGALDRALELLGDGAGEGGELVGTGIALYVERVGPGWETASVAI
jgi:aerobic carbon-monoxide dehydrogenase large subunit